LPVDFDAISCRMVLPRLRADMSCRGGLDIEAKANADT